MILITILRHVRKEDDEEHQHNDNTDGKIRRDEHIEISILQSLKICIAQQGALIATHRIEFGLNEVHGYKHTDDRATGIETLCQIKSSRGCLLWSHCQDIRITRGLQERQTTGHDEIGNQETAIEADAL